uniref:Immunoglobulin domain-containing protein n=1 Tax=Esox lucius TaxID=8010 RepID=A0AAY5KDT2_ESOLU
MRIHIRLWLCVFLLTDECCNKSVTETVHLGGEVTIICKYPENNENSIKYFCKEDNHSNMHCEIISDSTSAKSGRFILTDNRREKCYTVTISNLTEYDTGTYWCGVQNRTKDVLHYFSLFTELEVKEVDQLFTSVEAGGRSYGRQSQYNGMNGTLSNI